MSSTVNTFYIDIEEVLEYIIISENSSLGFASKPLYMGVDIEYVMFLSMSDSLYNVTEDTSFTLYKEISDSTLSQGDVISIGDLGASIMEASYKTLVMVNNSFSSYLNDNGIFGSVRPIQWDKEIICLEEVVRC